MSLVPFLFGLILNWILCTSWTWISISFPRLRRFSAIMSSTMFSASFYILLLSIYSLYSIYSVGLHSLLILFQRSLKQSSFFPFLFLFFCSASVIFTALFFSSFICSFECLLLLAAVCRCCWARCGSEEGSRENRACSFRGPSSRGQGRNWGEPFSVRIGGCL